VLRNCKQPCRSIEPFGAVLPNTLTHRVTRLPGNTPTGWGTKWCVTQLSQYLSVWLTDPVGLCMHLQASCCWALAASSSCTLPESTTHVMHQRATAPWQMPRWDIYSLRQHGLWCQCANCTRTAHRGFSRWQQALRAPSHRVSCWALSGLQALQCWTASGWQSWVEGPSICRAEPSTVGPNRDVLHKCTTGNPWLWARAACWIRPLSLDTPLLLPKVRDCCSQVTCSLPPLPTVTAALTSWIPYSVGYSDGIFSSCTKRPPLPRLASLQG